MSQIYKEEKMKRLIFFLVLMVLACFCYGQEKTSLMFGKSDIQILTWSNINGSPADSVKRVGTSGNINYEIVVRSTSTATGGVVKINFRNLDKHRGFDKYMKAGTVDSVSIANFKIFFNDTLSVNDKLRIRYTDKISVKVDSVGGAFEARWDSCYVDTVTVISATPDTIILQRDFTDGLTIITSANLQFRSNRINGWIFLAAGNNIFIPVRHTSNDTVFIKSASIPDVMIIRGK